MLFDTTFLIDYEREVRRSRPGSAHGFLVTDQGGGDRAYQRFDGATRDYLLELRLRHYTLLAREDAPGSQQGLDAVFVANG